MSGVVTDTVVLIYTPAFCMPVSVPGGRERPPLGLLHIGAALRQAGFGVRLFDFQDARTRWEDVEECLAASRIPLVGLSCDSDNIFRVLRMSDRILSRFPEARVVLGGPHVTHSSEPRPSARRVIVRGDGELPMVLLARHFLHGHGGLEEIPGLMFESEGGIHANPPYEAPAGAVDLLPCPDYSLLGRPEDYWPMMTTSRGCPHNCHFCSEGSRNFGYRPRSIASIERELVALSAAYGGSPGLMGFADDTFTSSAHRIRELCDLFDRVFPDKPLTAGQPPVHTGGGTRPPYPRGVQMGEFLRRSASASSAKAGWMSWLATRNWCSASATPGWCASRSASRRATSPGSTG